MQDLTDGAKGLTFDEDTEKTEKERMDIFYNKVFNSDKNSTCLIKSLSQTKPK